MRGLYLLVDLLTLSVPLLCSFYKKAPFRNDWKWVLPAILGVGIFFIFWDSQFTRIGVWGFNSNYILGYYAFGLPIEEILFFFCVPYSCMFIYFSLRHLRPTIQLKYSARIICGIAATICLFVAFANYDKWYTFTAFLGASVILIAFFLRKPFWLGHFILCYVISFIPFLLVNGILTGTCIPQEVVWYNNEENLGIRMLTIPIEDNAYSLFMLGSVVIIYEFLKGK